MSDSALRVEQVRDSRGLHDFVEAAYAIRGLELNWVPPQRSQIRGLLNRAKHPFHEHAHVEYFVAREGGRVIGRIAAIENHAHNQFHGERVGFFGFLDAEARADVFTALLAAAEEWAAARGLTHLRGPCSFSTNEECGLLVDGFDAPPAIMMPWNPPVYVELVEGAGYTKARDMHAWWIAEDCYNERFGRLTDIVLKRLEKRGLKTVVRGLDMARFHEELGRIRTIYNQAWEKNWGFVPMTTAEIDHMAKELKPVIVPDLVSFVEIDGEPAGFSFTLPDYNVALRFMRGRMSPASIAIFLLLRRRINMARMLTMGVVEKYRKLGLETLLIQEVILACRKRGIRQAEMGWILEDNKPMYQTIEGIGGRRYKTYRIYEKALA